MATVNATKRFKALIPETVRFRAQVMAIDVETERVKVRWGDVHLWVSSTLTLTVNDYVKVAGDSVVSKLPELPYLKTTIY